MTYTVKDLWTKQDPYPAQSLADVWTAVDYIMSGDEEYDNDELTRFYNDVTNHGAAYSRSLGLEVVSHE